MKPVSSVSAIAAIALACLFSVVLHIPGAQAVTTPQIMASSFSPGCMQWRVVGVCFWLLCTPKCRIKTSIKVRHYVPEVVVSSYANTGVNPWYEMALLSAPNLTAQGGGNMITPGKARDNLPRFKNVDVIGHPGSYLTMAGSALGYICESATYGFVPYYLSTLDTAAWRYGVPESIYPEALIPGVREVNTGLKDLIPGAANIPLVNLASVENWGSVYPRQGYLVQPDDGKAAAVMAQRAADFVTRQGQPHVYKSISAGAISGLLGRFSGWWPPVGGIVEGNASTHMWQMLHPQTSLSCGVFPSKSLVESAMGLARSSIPQDAQGAYAWALWRPYRCCKPRGLFLFSIGH